MAVFRNAIYVREVFSVETCFCSLLCVQLGNKVVIPVLCRFDLDMLENRRNDLILIEVDDGLQVLVIFILWQINGLHFHPH